MGDIKGRPKAPAPQVVYVPQYTSTPAPPAPNQNATNNENIEPSPEQQREKTLLGRPRSRIGTILTGFTGILAPSGDQSRRKVLLGE